MTSGVTYITAPQGTRTVTISDAAGRLVGRFERPSGAMIWNGFDLNGKQVSAGVYIIRAETGSGSSSAKVVISR
jgi:flagellar hook assembly protein FlgD